MFNVSINSMLLKVTITGKYFKVTDLSQLLKGTKFFKVTKSYY